MSYDVLINYFLLVRYLELLELFTFSSVREFTPFSQIELFKYLVRALFTPFTCSSLFLNMDRWLKGGNFNKKPVTEESHSTQSVEGRINDENGSQVVHHCKSNANGFMNPIKKRKYNESYLEIGFSETNDCQPQCVICLKVLPNSSMYPGKLRRHFEKTHPDYEGKMIDYFKRKRTELLDVQNKIKKHVQTDNENALKASYMVSYRIAQKGEAHTIAETLIKPCLVDIATCYAGRKICQTVVNNSFVKQYCCTTNSRFSYKCRKNTCLYY